MFNNVPVLLQGIGLVLRNAAESEFPPAKLQGGQEFRNDSGGDGCRILKQKRVHTDLHFFKYTVLIINKFCP